MATTTSRSSTPVLKPTVPPLTNNVDAHHTSSSTETLPTELDDPYASVPKPDSPIETSHPEQTFVEIPLSDEHDAYPSKSGSTSLDNATIIGKDVPNTEGSRAATITSQHSIYDRYPKSKKILFTVVLSFCSFLAPASSTTLLSAIPEIARGFKCDEEVITLSNSMFLLGMGLSPMFYGPMTAVFGRKWCLVGSAFLFTIFSIGTALAPNLPAFFIFRILTAFQGTSFLVLGSNVLGDIYIPTERATALGWFLMGTQLGPTIEGPFIGGVLVTRSTWRSIFWLQTALGGLAFLLVLCLLPETSHYKRYEEMKDKPKKQKARSICAILNPWRIIELWRYPNLIIVCLASAALIFNMYSLLTPIRAVLNPRFHLTTPLQSGLFNFAPGGGYLVGTFFAGRYNDYIVKKWKKKRDGERIPEDRLRGCVFCMGIVSPVCIVVYGWRIEKELGGIPLPVICMFIQGVSQLFCFTALNAYCLDVMQKRQSDVVAGNYILRFIMGAVGTALAYPAIRHIKVGWFSTISAVVMVLSTISLIATIRYGKQWREALDAKISARKMEKERP